MAGAHQTAGPRMSDSSNDGRSHNVCFILLSDSAIGNYHLGPLSPIAVWAILGSLHFPVGDVCCWVNLQLRRPGPATSDCINRGGKWMDGRGGGNWSGNVKKIQVLRDDTRTRVWSEWEKMLLENNFNYLIWETNQIGITGKQVFDRRIQIGWWGKRACM